jgi:hypothetical protein
LVHSPISTVSDQIAPRNRVGLAALHVPPAARSTQAVRHRAGVLLHAAQRRSLQNVSTSVLVVNSALACNGIATAHSLLNGAASSGVQPNHA